MATQAQPVRRLKHQSSRHGLRTITVRVGPENQTEDFTVHEDLLRTQSPFFDAAMRNNWAEAEERIIRLPEDDPDSFDVYRHWIYSRAICSQGETTDLMETNKEWYLLADSYILGEKLQDADFKDAVLDAMIEKMEVEKTFQTRLTLRLYKGTPKGSLIRQFMVDMHVWKAEDSWFAEHYRPHYDCESLFDIAAAFVKQGIKKTSAEKPPFMKDRCLYHEHTRSGTPCYKTKT